MIDDEESREQERADREAFYTDGGQEIADGVSLNIAGHDERKRERENGHDDAAALFGDEDGDTEDTPTVDAPSDLPTDDDGEEVEPVELLVQLADRGEIEPWDIDIVAVTDAFLDALDDADIRTGGRALFYASVLLRMKSDALMESDDPEEPEPWEEPWDAPPADADEDWRPDPFDALDREMDRRLERKRARGMPETLDELVRELREAERGSWWKESRTYDTSDSPKGFRRGTQTLDYHTADDLRLDDEPTADDVTGTAHQEDMETTIQHVYRDLREQYDAGRSEVLFAEVEQSGGARVETFLALLFLAHRKQIRLEQDELFGDLWIQDPAAADAPAEAVAD
ncbi:segregation and condensation protein A [Halomarina rubra]|uniref:Segregation/condensation protein A n=1 Tax=Halomarina rubra TaxID=2071873 RepID=A0ABD6AR89_9EURY|nr:ScpA family protein [Halomarina rubra]